VFLAAGRLVQTRGRKKQQGGPVRYSFFNLWRARSLGLSPRPRGSIPVPPRARAALEAFALWSDDRIEQLKPLTARK
jgi:hypothetical protein